MTGFASEFEQLFRDAYRVFHRRDGRRSGLTGASWAVLTHLSLTGPVTVGEAAQHLDRAQSVVSDIVTQLEGKGLVERRTDTADRRRTHIWITPEGVDALRADERVLGLDLLADAFERMPAAEATSLLASLRHLVDAAPATHERTPS